MRRALVAVYLHLVWATWDRLPLLDDAIERPIYRSIQAKADDLGVPLLGIGGVEDHVHLLTELPATLAVADLVKHLKGLHRISPIMNLVSAVSSGRGHMPLSPLGTGNSMVFENISLANENTTTAIPWRCGGNNASSRPCTLHLGRKPRVEESAQADFVAAGLRGAVLTADATIVGRDSRCGR